MLDAQPAVVFQALAGAADDVPHGIEPVPPATEGEPRFVTDIGMQELLIVIPDIRRIADDEGKAPGERAKPVAQYENDPSLPVVSGIDSGNSERFFTDISGDDVAGWALPGDGQCDRATTSAQIGDGERLSGRDALESRLHQAFSLRAWNQRVRIDL